MNSMKWHWLNLPPGLMSSMTFLALAVPWATATFSVAPLSQSQFGNEVLEQVRHRPDLVDGQLGVADALEAAHRHDVAVLVDGLQLAAGHQLQHGAQRRLHHAAGGAEDQAGAGGSRRRDRRSPTWAGGHVEAGLVEHLAQFAGGEPEVDVLVAAVAHLRPVALELLGRAGHEGHADDVGRVEAQLLGVVGLDESPEHLLRALGAGEVGDELGIEVLAYLTQPGEQLVNWGRATLVSPSTSAL